MLKWASHGILPHGGISFGERNVLIVLPLFILDPHRFAYPQVQIRDWAHHHHRYESRPVMRTIGLAQARSWPVQPRTAQSGEIHVGGDGQVPRYIWVNCI